MVRTRFERLPDRLRVAFACARLTAFMTIAAVACSPVPSSSKPQNETQMKGDALFQFSPPIASTANEPQVRDDVTFLVRFVSDHPLGRAQTLHARRKPAEAERLARAALRQERDLRGLCFERFTLGGAEIVLAPCTAPAPHRLRATQAFWMERFADMAGVEYAEPNRIAQIESRSPL